MARPCCGHAILSVIAALAIGVAVLSYTSDSATHWVLKQDGDIEEREHSPYNLRKPDDLLGFIQQDEYRRRLSELNRIIKDNAHKLDKADIEKDDDKQVEENFYQTEPECVGAPHRLVDLDLYSSTYLPLDKKGIKMADHLSCKPPTQGNSVPLVPDCRKPTLDFSPKAFEHLLGVQARGALPNQPEPALHGAFSDDFPSEMLGGCLKESLDKNDTSWVLLNIAALYWRIHGHYYQASECLRRALHFSPTRYRDIALLSLGNVLHRSQHSKDAIILLLSAIDISPNMFIHHFTLGNIYAVNRQWNLSAESYMRAQQIDSGIQAAADSIRAVRCQQKLEELLARRQRDLETTLRELEEYQSQHFEFQDIYQRYMDNIDKKATEDESVYAPLSTDVDDDNVDIFEFLDNSNDKPSESKSVQSKEHKSKDGAAAAAAPSSRPESSGSNDDQCPAVTRPTNTGKSHKSSPSDADNSEMCSTEDAVHHGQSTPNDAPSQKKHQCLVTEVTTEEIEDLRSRIDWATGGDSNDAAFNVEQARTEFERIIQSLDDPDPQLVALVKERLKILSSSHLGLNDVDTNDFNLLSDRLSSGQSCRSLKDEMQRLEMTAQKAIMKEAQREADQDPLSLTTEGEVDEETEHSTTTTNDDDVVMVTPEIDETDVEVDEYGDEHVDIEAKTGTTLTDTGGDSAQSGGQEKGKYFIKKCKRPRIMIKRHPSMNHALEPRERVPCSETLGRGPGKKLSERVCHRYGEEPVDPTAVEIDVPGPPPGGSSFPRKKTPQQQPKENTVRFPPVGGSMLADLNAQLPPEQRIPCPASNQGAKDNSALTRAQQDQQPSDDEAARAQLMMANAVRKVANELLKPNLSSLPGNDHPPVLSAKCPNVDKAAHVEPKPATAASEESQPPNGTVDATKSQAENKHPPRIVNGSPTRTENKHPPRIVNGSPRRTANRNGRVDTTEGSTPPVNGGSDGVTDAEVRWAQEQARFAEISEDRRRKGPQLPRYLQRNVSWSDVYNNSPRTVIGMTRRRNDTFSRVMDQRRRVLAKIQLLPLYNAWRQEEKNNSKAEEEEGEKQTEKEKDDASYGSEQHMPALDAPVVTEKECEVMPATPTWDHFPAIYIPPERHGVNVSALLAVGLPPSHIHPPPWTPPICVHHAALPFSMKSFDHLLGIQYRDQLPMVPEPALDNVITSLVDQHTTLEEIGQRLTTALEMSPQPAHWAIFHLAGLFFRVVGNPFHALECMRRAIHYAPLVMRDVPLVGMAEVLHRTGQMADAVVLLKAALNTHFDQPLIHFALGNALSSNGQFYKARRHHMYACHLQPALEAACLAVRYDECYRRRQVPPEVVNGQFRKTIVPSCTLQKCPIADTPMRRKYEVVSDESLTQASPELPEIVHRNDSVMHSYVKDMPTDFIAQSLKRISAANEKRASLVTEVRKMLKRDQDRLHRHVWGTPASAPPGGISDPTNAAGKSADTRPNSEHSEPQAKAAQDKVDSVMHHGNAGRAKLKLPVVTEAACKLLETLNLNELTSTWLSVEIKNVAIGDYIDLTNPEPLESESLREPYPLCPETTPFSALMMDHLEGVQDRQRFAHVNLSEPGLSHVLLEIGGKSYSLQAVAGHIHRALEQNESSWVLHNLAALVWRLKGRADHAVNCLRQALHYSPSKSRDVALVSLANVMARSRLFRDALILMSMALEVSPNFVVHHFTIANILATTGNLKEAEFFFRNTLTYQPDFKPAMERYLAVRCRLRAMKQRPLTVPVRNLGREAAVAETT